MMLIKDPISHKNHTPNGPLGKNDTLCTCQISSFLLDMKMMLYFKAKVAAL